MTSTAPALSAGVYAVMDVPGGFTLYFVAASAPNSTLVAPLKSVPVMVTLEPPFPGPLEGVTEVIAVPEQVNWSTDDVALVPPAAVTMISTTPALSAGDEAVITVPAGFTVNVALGVGPKSTT